MLIIIINQAMYTIIIKIKFIIIVGMLGSEVHYLFIYWARGLSRGREVVRGG